jgi:RNA polymerase sigma factor (sigma-70 family)
MDALEVGTQDKDSSLGSLYRRHSGWLRSVVRRSGRHDSEDIVQEAFLRLSAYPTGALRHPRALLLKVAQNVIRNSVRSARAVKNTPAEHNPLQSSDIVFSDQYELVLLKDVVLALPETYRDVFVLSRFDGMTNAQIATACNLSLKAVEWRLSKALALCADRLRD